MVNKRRIVNTKLTLFSLLCCIATSGCSNVNYVEQPQHPSRYVSEAPAKHYGAIVTADERDPSTGKIKKGRTFMLKRQDGQYAAETMLFNRSGQEGVSFERSYLSLAANHKKKQLGILLRFEY